MHGCAPEIGEIGVRDHGGLAPVSLLQVCSRSLARRAVLPAHLTGGAPKLYRQMDLTIRAEEWRQPGLGALATRLATSARQHKPIKVQVPTSYEPKTTPAAHESNDPSSGSLEGRACAGSLPEETSPSCLEMGSSSVAPGASQPEARATVKGRARADSLAEEPAACMLGALVFVSVWCCLQAGSCSGE